MSRTTPALTTFACEMRGMSFDSAWSVYGDLLECAGSSVRRRLVMHEYAGQERFTKGARDLLNCSSPFGLYLYFAIDKRLAKAVS
jgi:hypothetical protein